MINAIRPFSASPALSQARFGTRDRSGKPSHFTTRQVMEYLEAKGYGLSEKDANRGKGHGITFAVQHTTIPQRKTTITLPRTATEHVSASSLSHIRQQIIQMGDTFDIKGFVERQRQHGGHHREQTKRPQIVAAFA